MSPSPEAPERRRPALLAAAAVPPWPVRDGYSLRVAHLLEQLADRWRLTLVSPAPDVDDRAAAPADLTWRPVGGVPATTALPWRRERARLADRAEELLAGNGFAGALLWSGTEFLAGEVAGFPPAVVDRIDCEALQAWRKRRDCGSVRGVLRLLRRGVEMALYERRTLAGRAGVAAAGPDDARALRLVSGNRGIEVLPNGVVLPPLDELPDEGDRPRVVFTGTMSYGPNVTAVRWFAREVWPRVRERASDAEFVVAGRRPSPEVRALAEEEGIEVRADVPDLTAEIRRAWVAVAPMRSGSGIKNKVLEAWAAGRPVVLSDLATNGLELVGEHGERMRGLVCRDAGRMAEAVAGLLEDRPRRRALGRAARALAEERHGWEAAGDRLHRLLLASLPAADPAGTAETGDPRERPKQRGRRAR